MSERVRLSDFNRIHEPVGGVPDDSRPRPATPSRPRPRVTPSPVPYSSGEGTGSDSVPDPVLGTHSWLARDIVARRANPPAPPEIIRLFYAGYYHLVSGESESLKTWFALVASATELGEGRGVLWIDGDDVGEAAILERLNLLGVGDDEIARLFAYVAPDEPLDDDKLVDVLEVVRARACRLAVLDGFNPLLVLHGYSPDSGTDVENFYRLVNPIRREGVAVVLTDNVVKAKEARGPWAIGSERKKSKAEVHLGLTTLGHHLVRGGTGRAKIAVHKDRAGHLERPTVGVLELTSSGAWTIESDQSHGPDGFRPTVLMDRVSRHLELRNDAPSRSQIEGGVKGKAEHVRTAIDCLVAEGYATEFEGPRGARFVRLERSFREDEDEGQP